MDHRCVSRSRFWGTPLPIWVSEDGEERVVVSSIAQLEELTGEKVTIAMHAVCNSLLTCDCLRFDAGNPRTIGT